jgi:hypothetical protein
MHDTMLAMPLNHHHVSDFPLQGQRICLVLDSVIETDFRLRKTVAWLIESGAHVTIACLSDQNQNVTYFDALHGVKVWRLPRGPRLYLSSTHPIRVLRILKNILIANPIQSFQRILYRNHPLRGFAKHIAQKKFDVVSFLNYPTCKEALELRKLSDLPVIYESYENWQGMFEHNLAGLSSGATEKWQKVESACVKIASANILVSPEITENYRHLYPAGQFYSIYNVALQQPLEPSPVHTPLRYYFHSHLRPHYGLELLIQSFAHVKGDFLLTIQGKCLDRKSVV